jgi:16S rRNA (cytosine967-C5)-methyltransferase
MTNPRRNVRQADRLSAREAAFQAVSAALRGEGFAHETLARLRTHDSLEQREAGLAMEITLGAIRHALTIEHVLSKVARYDQRRVKQTLRSILLTAGFQVIWMDRIPEFAAVDQAVELARRHAGDRASRMVNALLRNLTRAIDRPRVIWQRLNPRQIRVSWEQACSFKADVLPVPRDRNNTIAHLAAATGERPERYRTLVDRYGEEQAEAVAWAAQALPVTVLHRNPLRIDTGTFQARMQETFGEQAEWTPDAVFLPSGVNVVDTTLFREGHAYVQDTTARAAALLLDARPGESLLDFCAAPGGKSIVLAQQIGDRGEVLACDASPDRIRRVADNARRLRLTSIRTHLIQTSDASDADLARRFDAALVDVPCSNTGVIARRPEARLGLTTRKLESLVELQAALLRRTAASVRPGGRLVYSTCSIEPEENEQVVARFLAENPAWTQLIARLTLPQWGPRLSAWRDGGFAALLGLHGASCSQRALREKSRPPPPDRNNGAAKVDSRDLAILAFL